MFLFHNKIISLALLLAGCTLICAAQLDVDLGKEGAIDPVKTTAIPITTSTSEAAKINTTSSTPTTSTTTTTTTTTTTPPPPAPTTAAPNTTTPQPAPTTTPAPAPYPDPSIGTWNSSCILIKMAAQLNFTYLTKDDKNVTTLYNIPPDAKVEDCNCNNNSQRIQINWGNPTIPHSMTLQFDKKNNTAQMVMMQFSLPLMSDRFPDAKDNQTIQLLHRGFDFSAPSKMSYHCTRAQKFNLTETIDAETASGYVIVRDVQTEAFRSVNATGFSTAKDCDSSETSDIVPIAVGCALASLILIVLISYLCARRRSTSRGYMSF